MSKTPKASFTSAGDDRNLVSVDENYLAPSFEDRLRLFWEKNSRTVIALCVMVVAVILGKGAYEMVVSQREKGIAADFAAAGDDAQQLKAFAEAHPVHVQGGLAQLKLADQAYTAGNFTEARTAYDKAYGILKKDTLGQRARLGAAFSALRAGAAGDGEAALKEIVADLSLDKIVRSEAAYHLASLAAEKGNASESIRLIEQSTVIDPEGHWADRASMLRATLPAPAAAQPDAPAGTEAAPTVSFK